MVLGSWFFPFPYPFLFPSSIPPLLLPVCALGPESGWDVIFAELAFSSVECLVTTMALRLVPEKEGWGDREGDERAGRGWNTTPLSVLLSRVSHYSIGVTGIYPLFALIDMILFRTVVINGMSSIASEISCTSSIVTGSTGVSRYSKHARLKRGPNRKRQWESRKGQARYIAVAKSSHTLSRRRFLLA